YARHHKSCQSQERSKPWHILRGLAPTITDECCALSVAAAKKANATFVDFDNIARMKANAAARHGKAVPKDLFKPGADTCPAGQNKARLKCESSKTWCAPEQ
ncbi:MAG: hypothetical protein AAF204_04550, partial [Pseudomonadota bacterium]